MKNIILITADEMRSDALGFMGNPDCQTPNLDRLAQRGVVFDQHFTVHGKCVPSRIAMLTGRYTHTDGFRTIHEHLPAGQPNVMSALRAAGYECAVFGLNHVWADLFPGEEKHLERSEGAADYHSFVGPFHDLAFAPPEHPYPESQHPPRYEPATAICEYKGRQEKPTGFPDINRAHQAVHYLRNVRDTNKSFYLQVNFTSPHPPYQCEEPFFSMYDRNQIQAWPYALPPRAPLPLREQRHWRSVPEDREDIFREIQATYYGMISRVDRDIGIVLDELEHQNLLQDSIILFTSDHGDYAGQYGLTEKWDTSMVDCLMHVPLILCGTDLADGTRVSALSEHVDLPRTLLDLAGLPASARWDVHGDHLLDIANGTSVKPAVFANGGHEAEMRARRDPNPPIRADGRPDGKQVVYAKSPESMARTKMVRTQDWKLVMRETGDNELYDLRADPHEYQNLWPDGTPTPTIANVIIKLQQLLIEWTLRTDMDRPYQEKIGA